MGQLQQSVVMIYNPNIIAALQFPGRARESAAVAAVGDDVVGTLVRSAGVND